MSLAALPKEAGAIIGDGPIVFGLGAYINGFPLSWNSNTKVDVGAGVCTDTTKTVLMNLAAGLTIDLATVGASGLDAGALAAATAYAVWCLSGPGGTTCVASTSFAYAGVARPVGYAVSGRRVGSFMSDPTVARVNPFSQNGISSERSLNFLDFPNFDNYTVFAPTVAGTYTTSFSPLVPPTAVTAKVYFYQLGGATHGGALSVAESGYSGGACAITVTTLGLNIYNSPVEEWGYFGLDNTKSIGYTVSAVDNTDPPTCAIALFGYTEIL